VPQLDVTWVLPDGRAGGRLPGGTIVRVEGDAVPGDTVMWESTSQRGHTVDGVVHARISDSPDRITPECPWITRCGGCDLATLSQDARHRALAQMVARAFRQETPPEVVPSPRPFGHRARIKLGIRDGQVGYRARRSHDLVDVDTCRIARPEVQAALGELRATLAGSPELTRGLHEVELRSDGTRVVFAFQSQGSVPRAVRERIATLGDVALDGRKLAGNSRLVLEVAGVRLQAGPKAFYQVNLEANALLVEHVLAQLEGCERALDLYSGIGNFAVPLAARGMPVLAVESVGQAVGDLARAAEGLPVTAITQRVERFDPARHAFDAVILDPPRAGARGVLKRLVRNRPKVIVYVACHAPAAARDLKEAPGYTIRSVRCFDLFPDTHHIESVVTLVRT
jgi:23S rRNA (uracil1939-C5)-methyltransferase